jgi:hypothetical protein
MAARPGRYILVGHGDLAAQARQVYALVEVDAIAVID